MFIRQCYRQKNGKRHAYWALVESYRTARGPRQRVISYLGQAEEPLRRGVQQNARGTPYQRMLFDEVEPAWVEVDPRGLRVERCLDFGGPWLALELFKHLGLTERVEAHILVCFLAYVLWKTLGQMCRQAGLGDEPRRVFEELGKIRVVDVVLPTRSGQVLRRRCVSQPSDHQAILLQRLGLNLPKNLPLAGEFLRKM
jgi:hypothetical protein